MEPIVWLHGDTQVRVPVRIAPLIQILQDHSEVAAISKIFTAATMLCTAKATDARSHAGIKKVSGVTAIPPSLNLNNSIVKNGIVAVRSSTEN